MPTYKKETAYRNTLYRRITGRAYFVTVTEGSSTYSYRDGDVDFRVIDGAFPPGIKLSLERVGNAEETWLSGITNASPGKYKVTLEFFKASKGTFWNPEKITGAYHEYFEIEVKNAQQTTPANPAPTQPTQPVTPTEQPQTPQQTVVEQTIARSGTMTIWEAKALAEGNTTLQIARAEWSPLRRLRRIAPAVWQINSGTSGSQWRTIAASDLTYEDWRARDWLIWQTPSDIVDAQIITDTDAGNTSTGITVNPPAHKTDFSTLPGGVAPITGQYIAIVDNGMWIISAGMTEWRFIDGGIPQ